MDANDKEYTYEVIRSFVADKTDVWVIDPIPEEHSNAADLYLF